MPYLEQKFKNNIEQGEDLSKQCYYSETLIFKDFLGYLNYKIFVLVKNYITINGKRYWIFAGIIGTLICCVVEIYRRIIAPYEDEKIKDNGDVGVYKRGAKNV